MEKNRHTAVDTVKHSHHVLSQISRLNEWAVVESTDRMRMMSSKKDPQGHAVKQVARSHRYQVCTLNHHLMSTSHCHSIWQKACFAAARDGCSSRDEDPDAWEAGETFIPKAACPLQCCAQSLYVSNSVCSCHLQVDEQKKENERLWAAISRSTLREAGCDSNGNHRSDRMPRDEGGRGGGFTKHGGRSAGASVWDLGEVSKPLNIELNKLVRWGVEAPLKGAALCTRP